MPLEKKIETPEGLLGIWRLNETSQELARLFSFQKNEKYEFEKRNAENRKKEFLAARLLLEILTGKKQFIHYNKWGKPHLENKHEISISHSSEYLAIIISGKNTGIDIENITRNVKRIENRFLSKKELSFLEQTKNPDVSKIVYWSAKEAIFKCACITGVLFNKHIFINPFELEERGEFTGILKTSESTIPYKLSYFFIESNVVTWCSEM